MQSEPDRNSASKFAVTEREAWFIPVLGGAEPPRLVEMLHAAVGVNLRDEAAVREMDEILEGGGVLLGYRRESGEVEIHSSLFVPYPSALRRLKEVFGDVEVVGIGWTASTGGRCGDE